MPPLVSLNFRPPKKEIVVFHQVETHQHLSEVEKKKAMDLLLACKPHDSAIPLVAFAWGVNATTMRRIYKKMLQSPMSSVARKKRADAGNNLINSDAKRHSRFTQEFVCGEDGKPMGVEVLTCYDDSEEEEDDDENNNQKLRYEKPNVEEVVKENLQRMTSSEVYTLFHELPQEHPWFNDVMDAFLALDLLLTKLSE